jgi:hypothetical protein
MKDFKILLMHMEAFDALQHVRKKPKQTAHCCISYKEGTVLPVELLEEFER